jgi:hypothetical protein
VVRSLFTDANRSVTHVGVVPEGDIDRCHNADDLMHEIYSLLCISGDMNISGDGMRVHVRFSSVSDEILRLDKQGSKNFLSSWRPVDVRTVEIERDLGGMSERGPVAQQHLSGTLEGLLGACYCSGIEQRDMFMTLRRDILSVGEAEPQTPNQRMEVIATTTRGGVDDLRRVGLQ